MSSEQKSYGQVAYEAFAEHVALEQAKAHVEAGRPADYGEPAARWQDLPPVALARWQLVASRVLGYMHVDVLAHEVHGLEQPSALAALSPVNVQQQMHPRVEARPKSDTVPSPSIPWTESTDPKSSR
jgi:hypothetical protein